MMSKSVKRLKPQHLILPFKQGVRGSNPRWVTKVFRPYLLNKCLILSNLSANKA